MKIHEILNEKYSLTAECNNMARFHTHDYYRHLDSTGAVNSYGKGVLPAIPSKWQYECSLNTDYISDKESNFYLVGNNVTISFSLDNVNGNAITYQEYLNKSRKGLKIYSGQFDADQLTISVVIDPVLLDPREENLQFMIYRILMHEISHVYHYSKTLTNYELDGKMPEQNKPYHLQSFEIDARYRDGWADLYYFQKVKKRLPTLEEGWESLKRSILRNGAYKIPVKVIEKYKKKYYQDYQEFSKGNK